MVPAAQMFSLFFSLFLHIVTLIPLTLRLLVGQNKHFVMGFSFFPFFYLKASPNKLRVWLKICLTATQAQTGKHDLRVTTYHFQCRVIFISVCLTLHWEALQQKMSSTQLLYLLLFMMYVGAWVADYNTWLWIRSVTWWAPARTTGWGRSGSLERERGGSTSRSSSRWETATACLEYWAPAR